MVSLDRSTSGFGARETTRLADVMRVPRPAPRPCNDGGRADILWKSSHET